jgi:hypothetical protein
MSYLHFVEWLKIDDMTYYALCCIEQGYCNWIKSGISVVILTYTEPYTVREARIHVRHVRDLLKSVGLHDAYIGLDYNSVSLLNIVTNGNLLGLLKSSFNFINIYLIVRSVKMNLGLSIVFKFCDLMWTSIYANLIDL